MNEMILNSIEDVVLESEFNTAYALANEYCKALAILESYTDDDMDIINSFAIFQEAAKEDDKKDDGKNDTVEGKKEGIFKKFISAVKAMMAKIFKKSEDLVDEKGSSSDTETKNVSRNNSDDDEDKTTVNKKKKGNLVKALAIIGGYMTISAVITKKAVAENELNDTYKRLINEEAAKTNATLDEKRCALAYYFKTNQLVTATCVVDWKKAYEWMKKYTEWLKKFDSNSPTPEAIEDLYQGTKNLVTEKTPSHINDIVTISEYGKKMQPLIKEIGGIAKKVSLRKGDAFDNLDSALGNKVVYTAREYFKLVNGIGLDCAIIENGKGLRDAVLKKMAEMDPEMFKKHAKKEEKTLAKIEKDEKKSEAKNKKEKPESPSEEEVRKKGLSNEVEAEGHVKEDED